MDQLWAVRELKYGAEGLVQTVDLNKCSTRIYVHV